MSASPKKAKKPAAKKASAEHPKYAEMIIEAISALKERKGSSRQAILKYVQANFKVGDNAGVHLKMALKRGVTSGALKQTKGTGASGSFKVAEKPKAAAKKPAAKKPAAKKPAAKKPAAKKSTPAKKKSTTKKSTPKKKPAAKKAKKPAAKKPVAAKKPAAKKAKKTPKKASKAKK